MKAQLLCRPVIRRRVVWALFCAAVMLVVQACPSLTARAATGTTVSPGWDIFDAAGGGYRYGPSMFEDSAGLHMYTCSPGAVGQPLPWDYIRYRNSTDGGRTWSADKIVLKSNAGSLDRYSVCDPGVVFSGGYYYLGYTSTADASGGSNNVFVARSTSPTGPFKKWNGHSWGGDPVPAVTYGGGPKSDYGAGEPSLVVVGSTLYVYYSWLSHDASGRPIKQTRVATAPAGDANWPASLTYRGIAINKRVDQAPDSDDVKYIDAYHKFIAVNTFRRSTAKAYIQMWESGDGIHFTPATMGRDNLKPFLHNVGLSGDRQGHIDISTPQYVGYAYGSVWARWNTALHRISFADDDRPAAPQIYSVQAKNNAIRLEFQTDAKASGYTIHYGTRNGDYTSAVNVRTSPATLTGLANGTTYYLVVDAVNGHGTSPHSAQVPATPQPYTPIHLTHAASSSTTPGWPARNAIDGNPATVFSSAGHTSPTATEWLTVDAGTDTPIGRLVITNRKEQYGAPKVTIQISSDGKTRFDEQYATNLQTIVDDDGYTKSVIDFPRPMYGRYVRLHATTLNPDSYGNNYLQIAEIQAYSVPLAASASSSIPNWEPQKVLDDNPNTVYSSTSHATTSATEWLALDLGSKQQVTRVLVTPRPKGQAFPVDFSLQTSTDGRTWSTAPGQKYTGYTNPGSITQSFSFAAPVTARYVRLLATRLGTDDNGIPYLQIAKMTTDDSLPATATASSYANEGWEPKNATDGVSQTLWSSTAHTTQNATEWLQLDLHSDHRVRQLRVVPRDNAGFPKALTISHSTDGRTWTQIPGQSYSTYADPSGATPNPVQLFAFSSPVTARYLRITATKLRPDNHGNYYFQVADIYIDQ
jgi:hypothetical protein